MVGYIPGREGGGISTTLTTATTIAGERVDSDEDDDTIKTPTVRTTTTSFFDTTTNLWSDAFLAGNKYTDGEDNNDLIFLHNNQPVGGCIPGREGGGFNYDDAFL